MLYNIYVVHKCCTFCVHYAKNNNNSGAALLQRTLSEFNLYTTSHIFLHIYIHRVKMNFQTYEFLSFAYKDILFLIKFTAPRAMCML